MFNNGLWYYTSLVIADTLTGTAASGCDSIVTKSITVLPSPMLSIIPATDTIILGNSIIVVSSGANSYLWDTGETTAAITVNPGSTSIYCVIGSNVSCFDTACSKIYVIECGDNNLFIPNAFSPNGDGQNDQLCIYGASCIETMQLKIFDRWGNNVFESANPQLCWDGTFKGKVLDSSVLAFYFKAAFTNQKEIELKGNISLIK